MPLYCYVSDAGDTLELFQPMDDAKWSIRRNGVTYHRDLHAEHGRFKNTPGNWPMVSDAMGVHPSQIPEATEQLRRAGITESEASFVKNGGLKLETRRARTKCANALRFFDRDAAYGDPQRRHS